MLTKGEIMNAKAGNPELIKSIAELMGYEIIEASGVFKAVFIGDYETIRFFTREYYEGHELKRVKYDPTANIKQAWEVVEKLHAEGNCLSLDYQAGLFSDDFSRFGWSANFRMNDGAFASGKTECIAIVRAALLTTAKEEPR